MSNLSRLCIHTETVKPLQIEDVVEKFFNHGIPGVSVWRHTLENRDLSRAGKMFRDRNLNIVSLVRGGFFPSVNPNMRKKAIDENKRAISEAHQMEIPLLVIVCGSDPQQLPEISRQQIEDGIYEIIPFAESNQVKLAIEPLHPMYTDSRSAINTIKQANDMVERINSPWVGIAVDVYHVWWDDMLENEINRAGKLDKIFAFHVSDWKVPTEDMLLDRGLMGEGCIPIKQIRQWVEQAGFNGYIEVEIFSKKYWAMDQDEYLEMIKEAYLNNV